MAEHVRYAFANGNGASRTVTFSEVDPLDSSHVLVVFHYHNQSSDPTTPSGWTRVLIDTTVSGRRFYIYVRRGNGSVNSFTFSSGTSSVPWAMAMVAYQSDLGSLTLGTAVGHTIGTNVTSITSPTLTPDGYGVAVCWGWIGNSSASRTWGDGFTEVRAQSGYYPLAEKVTDQPVTPSLSWSEGNLAGIHTVFIPLAEPPDPEPEDNLDWFAYDGTLVPVEPLGVRSGGI